MNILLKKSIFSPAIKKIVQKFPHIFHFSKRKIVKICTFFGKKIVKISFFWEKLSKFALFGVNIAKICKIRGKNLKKLHFLGKKLSRLAFFWGKFKKFGNLGLKIEKNFVLYTPKSVNFTIFTQKNANLDNFFPKSAKFWTIFHFLKIGGHVFTIFLLTGG